MKKSFHYNLLHFSYFIEYIMDAEKEKLIKRYMEEHRRLVEREREYSLFYEFYYKLDLKI